MWGWNEKYLLHTVKKKNKTRKELDAVISRFSRLLQKFPSFTILGEGQSIKITRAFVKSVANERLR
jgi:hypothetical protein